MIPVVAAEPAISVVRLDTHPQKISKNLFCFYRERVRKISALKL